MPTLQIEPQTSAAAHQPSPALIFDTLSRHQHTMALKGAIELDLFTHIGAGASTPADIAARCHASERGVRILCDFLVIIGFLRKANGSYQLTSDSAMFLNKTSPAYSGGIAHFIASPAMLDRFRDIAALVRKGGNVAGLLEKENGEWVEFARLMTPVVALAAQLVAPAISRPNRRQKVLDIAAGSGIFGISIARLNPVAEIVALDSVNVLEVAKENAVRRGVQERYRTIAGNAFKVDLGSGYDTVLIPNFLHHFDAATNIEFLKRVRAAMNSGGRVATVEFVPNEDRVTPPVAAAFSLVMLGNTERGDAYTFRELDQMFREAGFGESSKHDLSPTPLTLLVTAF
jgi:2-polyprenyl-3-methyl-5-hydroxy-6-metoxy-1,4-benzoquinol methylase